MEGGKKGGKEGDNVYLLYVCSWGSQNRASDFLELVNYMIWALEIDIGHWEEQ